VRRLQLTHHQHPVCLSCRWTLTPWTCSAPWTSTSPACLLPWWDWCPARRV